MARPVAAISKVGARQRDRALPAESPQPDLFEVWAGLTPGPSSFADVLHRAALAAGSSLELKEIFRRLAGLALEAVPADRATLYLLDETGTKLVPAFATGGVPDISLWRRFKGMQPVDLKAAPARWQAFSAGRAIDIPDMSKSPLVPREVVEVFRSRSALLVPLRAADESFGLLSLDWVGPRRELDYEEVELAESLGAYAALAIRNARLYENLQRRLPRLEVLYHLSDVVAGTADITAALRRLNRVLAPETGIRLQSISIVNAEARDAAGAAAPGKDEMEAIRSWRATLARSKTPPRPKETSAGVLVPIVHRNRVQGALRVFIDSARPAPEPELLSVIGSGCAEVIYKAGLRRDLAESERRLLISSERDRIARDLHDSVGQVLTGLALRLGELAAQAPDRAWRNNLVRLKELATRGSEEVRDSIYALLFLDVRKKGLHRALKELAAKFEATTGIQVEVKVEGGAASIPTLKEDALFRVAHEALMNVERHSKAAFVNVVLGYDAEDTWVWVRDDGVGLAHRDPFRGKAGHFGLRGLTQLMEEVGGRLEIKNATPRGVVVEGRIPRRRTRRTTTDADDPSTRRR